MSVNLASHTCISYNELLSYSRQAVTVKMLTFHFAKHVARICSVLIEYKIGKTDFKREHRVNREVKFDVYGKRQTENGKLLPSVFSSLYSRIKIFVFAVNSKRHFSIFV